MNFFSPLLLSFLLAVPPSHPDLVQRTLLSVVKILHTISSDTDSVYLCTGVIVDAAKGYILTAEHCVDKNEETYVNASIPATIVKVSEDLAIIKAEPMMGPPIQTAKEVKVGEEVVSIGYGDGHLMALWRHIASFYNDSSDIQLDGDIIQGMSGGPIVNENGELVGINQISFDRMGGGSGPKEIRNFLKSVK